MPNPEWLKPIDPDEQIDPTEIHGMDEFEGWEEERNNPAARIKRALNLASRFSGIAGEHHKTWVIDQIVRSLTGSPVALYRNLSAVGGPIVIASLGESEEYKEFVRKYNEGDQDDLGFDIDWIGEIEELDTLWDEGIAP